MHVLNENYLEAFAGGEYERQELSPGRKTVEKRFAASLLQSEPCQLAAQECAIELADVDQLKLDPSYRSHKLKVVIARTAFTYTPRHGRRGPSYPVYLVAGGFKTMAPTAPVAFAPLAQRRQRRRRSWLLRQRRLPPRHRPNRVRWGGVMDARLRRTRSADAVSDLPSRIRDENQVYRARTATAEPV